MSGTRHGEAEKKNHLRRHLKPASLYRRGAGEATCSAAQALNAHEAPHTFSALHNFTAYSFSFMYDSRTKKAFAQSVAGSAENCTFPRGRYGGKLHSKRTKHESCILAHISMDNEQYLQIFVRSRRSYIPCVCHRFGVATWLTALNPVLDRNHNYNHLT